MWTVTTDEEANFVFDLNAEPDNTAVVLEYAKWLEDRDPLRAEFLRLDLDAKGNENRLRLLREQLDRRWLATVTARRFRAGDVVRVTGGLYAGTQGHIHSVDAVGGRADVDLHLFYFKSEPTWVLFDDLVILKRAPSSKNAMAVNE
jgi:uncharacterized protein (TIGR02996 family)